jgi:DNA polymerase-3 subunit delta
MQTDLAKLIKNIPPVVFIFGEEEFLIEEAIENILKPILISGKNEFNLDIFDGEMNTDLNAIIDVASTFPFMSDRRVVVVKNFNKFFQGTRSKKIDTNHPLVRYLDSPPETTILLIQSFEDSLNGLSNDLANPKNQAKAEKKIIGAKFPYNLLLTKIDWLEFPKIYDNALPSWLINRTKEKGKRIGRDAADLLLAHINPNLRDLANEIEKLIIFSGDDKEISVDHVAKLVGVSKNYNVFELQKAVGERSSGRSIEIVENMLRNERNEVLITSMLTKYFISLAKIKDWESSISNKYELASKTGINAYFLNEYTNAARKYSPEDIDNAFIELAKADLGIKSNTASTTLIIQKCIIRIIDGKNKA